jgi:protoporphyrin/coproporphyrin ferrochelatase
MAKYHGPFPGNDKPDTLGVLLTNLGTPDAPTTKDVRRYLAEFLSDPRVVEMPRLLWWLILHGVILRTRPARSAAAYRKIWSERGSPLLAISYDQTAALQKLLEQQIEQPVRVELAMRYGKPSIANGLERLRQANARRIIVLPLYPQYSATTTASTFDAIAQTLQQWRWLPELKFISHYHDHPDYIAALTESVQDHWLQHGKAEKLLMSFHGIPQDYADKGDPYPDECITTAHLLADRLGLTTDDWAISFQSRLGRKQWLKPYTDETLTKWGRVGVKSVQVICPGFPTDCLETLEEIAVENRDVFIAAGGEGYSYIPALNSSPEHIHALHEIVKQAAIKR